MDEMIPAWVEGQLAPVEKLAVHLRGLRHKAVSVFVLSERGILIQQRALAKYHTPGLWANTCCTHPRWGEADAECAARRLREELGIVGLHLQAAGRVEYRAEVGGGMVEHEEVALFRAVAPADLALRLNADEVMAARWVELAALQAEIAAAPEAFTPWLRIYLADHSRQILGPVGG
ncbi:isopentenyl-diphosphate Delta-isomerase [Tabrizicola oligotrophica]|nr:isopentenyl-diphosphate Delta-isomerase [Tabrizicola oligotrophica]